MSESKLLELLQLLIQRRRGATKREMADALGRGPRQVERYLNQLADAGFPIVADSRENDGIAHRWRLDREGFHGLPSEIPPLGLGFPEQFAVAAALELARLPHCRWLDDARQSAIEKLCVYLPGSDGRRLPLFRAGVVAVGPDEGRVERIHQAVIQGFADGAVRRRVVRLSYSWGGQRIRARDVEPLGMGLIYGGIYGVAIIRPYNEPRWLNLARATRARVCEGEEFTPPKDFNLRAFMQANFGIWDDDQPRHVRVRFDAKAARAVRSREIHPTQRLEEEPDGAVILHLDIGGRTEFLWWLLGWGASAELLEPKEWREAMGQEVERMRSVYKKSERQIVEA
jgi:predicted DNA-binding transcriptional regulator YafY